MSSRPTLVFVFLISINRPNKLTRGLSAIAELLVVTVPGVRCSGMGRAVAESLLSAGAVVYALDKSQPHLDSLVSEVMLSFLWSE